MKKHIFVPGVGQHENIGDIILRRPLINWLREHGNLHIYVGKSSEGYDRGLGIQKTDTVYYSFFKWYVAALKNSLLCRAHYVFKPGEIQMSLIGLKEHIAVIPLIFIIRISGGVVIRVGSGARSFSFLPKLFMKPSIWLSSMLYWRDPQTTSYMGNGQTMPDLAFAEGADREEFVGPEYRKYLVVSMRGDREHPSDDWIYAVKKYADIHNLSIFVITQVLDDADLSATLAKKFDAQLMNWNGLNHDEQEKKLRALYAQTHTAVSDRLHVLITALTHGALPVGMLLYASEKINRHFESIGVKNVSIFANGLSENAIFEAMKEINYQRFEILEKLVFAREKLDKIKQQIHDLLDR